MFIYYSGIYCSGPLPDLTQYGLEQHWTEDQMSRVLLNTWAPYRCTDPLMYPRTRADGFFWVQCKEQNRYELPESIPSCVSEIECPLPVPLPASDSLVQHDFDDSLNYHVISATALTENYVKYNCLTDKFQIHRNATGENFGDEYYSGCHWDTEKFSYQDTIHDWVCKSKIII